jgi:hypothetical protein
VMRRTDLGHCCSIGSYEVGVRAKAKSSQAGR